MTPISAYIELFIRGKSPGEMSGGMSGGMPGYHHIDLLLEAERVIVQ